MKEIHSYILNKLDRLDDVSTSNYYLRMGEIEDEVATLFFPKTPLTIPNIIAGKRMMRNRINVNEQSEL